MQALSETYYSSLLCGVALPFMLVAILQVQIQQLLKLDTICDDCLFYSCKLCIESRDYICLWVSVKL